MSGGLNGLGQEFTLQGCVLLRGLGIGHRAAGVQRSHRADGVCSAMGLPAGGCIPHCSCYLQCVRPAGNRSSSGSVDRDRSWRAGHLCRPPPARPSLGSHPVQPLPHPEGLFTRPAAGVWNRLQRSLPPRAFPLSLALPDQCQHPPFLSIHSYCAHM